MGLKILDVILGMVFMYLLLSLAVTALNEVIAQWFNSRAATLREGIQGLLSKQGSGPKVRRSMVTPRPGEVDPGADDVETRYMKAMKRLVDARSEIGSAVATETATRREIAQAIANLTTALSGSADSAMLASLQKRIDDLRIELANAQKSTGEASAKLAPAQQQYDALVKDPTLQPELDVLERIRGHALVADLYDHPLIQGLSQKRMSWRLKTYRSPSYIPARAFSAALLDLLTPGAPATSATLALIRKKAEVLPRQIALPLLVFLDHSGTDVERFRTSLEHWYEDGMERVSGLYKRKTQFTVLVLATVVTLTTNADTIRVARALDQSASVRAAVVAQAEALANNPSDDIKALLDAERARRSSSDSLKAGLPATASAADSADADSASVPDADSVAKFRLRQITTSIDSLESTGLPMGWKCIATATAATNTGRDNTAQGATTTDAAASAQTASGDSTTSVAAKRDCSWWKTPDESSFSRLFGLLITVLAISLGAPFWFDMLNKIVNIRSAGRAPEEQAKSPEALPLPTGAGGRR